MDKDIIISLYNEGKITIKGIVTAINKGLLTIDDLSSLVLTLEDYKQLKLLEVSKATEAIISIGIDITTEYGEEHFSLTNNDQVNLTNLFILISNGKTALPYHADGKICVLYTAADIITLYTKALEYVTYYTTYHNYLKQWINRETDIEVVKNISFGDELPEDLATEMATMLASTS